MKLCRLFFMVDVTATSGSCATALNQVWSSAVCGRTNTRAREQKIHKNTKFIHIRIVKFVKYSALTYSSNYVYSHWLIVNTRSGDVDTTTRTFSSVQPYASHRAKPHKHRRHATHTHTRTHTHTHTHTYTHTLITHTHTHALYTISHIAI